MDKLPLTPNEKDDLADDIGERLLRRYYCPKCEEFCKDTDYYLKVTFCRKHGLRLYPLWFMLDKIYRLLEPKYDKC